MNNQTILLAIMLLLAAPASADLVVEAPDTLILPHGTVLRVADGEDAPAAWGQGEIVAADGGPGGSIILRAPQIVVQGHVVLEPGDGGAGGDVYALGGPMAVAHAGDGGPAGRVIIDGFLVGAPDIRHATGGRGGDAHAQADPACDGAAGDDAVDDPGDAQAGDGDGAEARGGDGHCIPWDQTGGRGGRAEAYGGDGGPGLDGNGGAGGDAFAYPGHGGDGLDACFEDEQAAVASGAERAAHGGPGGTLIAIGGRGGDGALTGGNGGDAGGEAHGGDGGDGTYVAGGRDAFSDVDERVLVIPGSGGPAVPAGEPGEVLGGDGGMGAFGGAGGSVTVQSFGGDGGDACRIEPDLSDLDLPLPGMSIVAFIVLAAAGILRSRRP